MTAVRVRERRERLGLTRQEIADQAGVSLSMVTRIELYGHVPNALAFDRIARALGVTVDELLRDSESAA